MGEENKPKIATGGENNNADAQNKKNRNRHRWSQGQHQGGKFKGKTKEIEFDTFDNTGQHDAAQFNKSLKNIADYLQLNHGNDVSEAVRNLTPVNITVPPQPTGEIDPNDATKRLPVTEVDLYLWKRAHSKSQDRRDKYDELSYACRMSVSAIFSQQCRVGRHVGDMSPGRHHVSAILGPDNVVSFLSAPDMSASRT